MFVLGHSYYDPLIFTSSDLELTRRLVHRYADTAEDRMDAADGTLGRRLLAIVRDTPFELERTDAWVLHQTHLEQGSHAYVTIAGLVYRAEQDPELAPRIPAWIDDLRSHAVRGTFFYSLNDYAVRLRWRA